ncbi:MAG: hypothetical protein ACK48C_03975 [Roseiflexaceae bacterium]
MKGRRLTCSSVLVVVAILLVIVLFTDNSDTETSSSETSSADTVVLDSTVDESSVSDGTESNAAEESQPAEQIQLSRGQIIADSGFDINRDGFSFENYGNESGVVNLRANDMRRLFGDEVCSRINNEKCVLTPPARAWMKEINNAMDGGHCEGMAVLSLHLYHQLDDPNRFGAGETADLPFENNDTLQSEIAYWWATQSTTPTYDNMIHGKPSDIVKLLEASLSQGQGVAPNTMYTIGIYMSDGTGGHAVTPVSLVQTDENEIGINIYDNNYPGELRTIYVNTQEETWWYEGSPNPEIESDRYEGDASTETLELTPSEPRTTMQDCVFCGGKTSRSSKGYHTYILDMNETIPGATAAANTTGQSLFVTPDGKRVGYVDGKIINEIDGASVTVIKSAPSVWDNRGMPLIRIPDSISVTLQLQNDDSFTYDIVAFGNDNVLKVEGLAVSQTESSRLTFGSGLKSLKLMSAVKSTPSIYFGEVGANKRDTATQFSNIDIADDGELSLLFDDQDEEFTIDGDIIGDYDLDVVVSDEEGDVAFSYDDLNYEEKSSIAFAISQIVKEGDDLTFQVDTDGDGAFEESYSKEDDDLQIDASDFEYDELQYEYEEDELDI